MNKKKILKLIRSLEKKQKEHEKLIKDEKKKNPYNPVLGYWDKEIENFKTQIKQLKNKAKEKAN